MPTGQLTYPGSGGNREEGWFQNVRLRGSIEGIPEAYELPL
jgi:hypothetical protein